MARKAAPAANPEHGVSDVVGLVLISIALLLLVALFSYERADIPLNNLPANQPKHNWIGPIGAWLAYGVFFAFGAAGYLLPALLFGFGLAYLVDALKHLRGCWHWAGLLLIAFVGLLDQYSPMFSAFKANLDSGSAGGFLGLTINDRLFDYCGRVGATIIFFTFWLISLLYLTNFHLAHFWRGLFTRKEGDATTSPADAELERRARQLEDEARRLQQEVEKSNRVAASAAEKAEKSEIAAKPNAVLPVEPAKPSGLGPDLMPVPEPTVRDLSVPQLKSARPGKAKPSDPAPPTPAPNPTDKPVLEGEVISAREIAAATSGEVLGRKPGEKAKDAAGAPAEAPPSPPAPSPDGAKDADLTLPAALPGAGPSAPDVAATPDSTPPPNPAAPRPKPPPRKPKQVTVAASPQIKNYQCPSIDLLNSPDLTVKPTETKEELMANARLMQQTLAQFGIEVALGDITKGPTITRYELHPAPGVKLEKISGLTNNIAAALKAERIHILAPVPGKSSVGVEVPNLIKTKVIMRDILESEEWQRTKARIPLALGKDVYGHPIVADLGEMPHLLIAGSTGSGKSVCINSIIASLLYRFSPDQVRFVMIDPKVVELQQYNVLPHLVVPVVTDPKKVILALRWVVSEMEKRYQIFARMGVRNISSFNSRPKDKPLPKREPELPLSAKKEKIEPGADGFAVELDEAMVTAPDEEILIPEKLSYIVVIIDELADLMLVAPADVEMAIARITQMARAAGIHCIVATQRPSVDVITGVIKANIPARIAFQVAAKVDSRTILDAMGADKLLGKGDMLYLPPGSAKLIRAQGALVTDQEIQSIVDFIAPQGKPSYEVEIHQQLSKPAADFDGGGSEEDEDLIQQCIEVIRSEQKASVSLMQRRLRLGYTRAARIMDELEQRGIVGPSKGAEPRDILIDLDHGGADGGGQQAV